MTTDSKREFAEFEHFETINDSNDLNSLRNFIEDPHLEINKHEIASIFAKMNVEVNASELAKAMEKYSPFALKEIFKD